VDQALIQLILVKLAAWWNAATGQLVDTVLDPGGKAVNSVAFSPDGKTLATGDANGSINLWDIATGNTSAIMTDPASGDQGVGAVAFSPDGQILAVGDTNGTTYLWKVT